MTITRSLAYQAFILSTVAALAVISGLLLYNSLFQTRYIQVTLLGLGLFFGWLTGYMAVLAYRLGRLEIDKVRQVMRSYTLFGSVRVEFGKHEVKRFAIRNATTNYSSSRDMVVLTEGEAHVIPLLGMTTHLHQIHRFFRKHQYDPKVEKLLNYRDFRAFGWIMVAIGGLVTVITLSSLMGSKALALERFDVAHVEMFTVNADRYVLNYNDDNLLTSVDISDDGKSGFIFKLKAPYFSSDDLNRLSNELDKGYLVVQIATNKELFEEKVYGVDHPINFNERHFHYDQIPVFQLKVGELTVGSLQALASASGGNGKSWFAAFGLLLILGGAMLIKSFKAPVLG